MLANIVCFKNISSVFKAANLCAGIMETIVLSSAGNFSSSSVQNVLIDFSSCFKAPKT